MKTPKKKKKTPLCLILWYYLISTCTSVQFGHSVVSDSLQPHESQHTRPPCPSPTPRVYSNSCPSSRWCHPAISSSVIPFSFCPQSLPASESFPMSQLFAWGGQSIIVRNSSCRVISKSDCEWLFAILAFEKLYCLVNNSRCCSWLFP